MQENSFYEANGRITYHRVLDLEGPKIESSYCLEGKMRDGVYCVESKDIVTVKGGDEIATVKS
jgi:hypothetical protein